MYADHLGWMMNDTFECTHKVTDTHTDGQKANDYISLYRFTNLGGIIDQSAALQITHHIKCQSRSRVNISFSTVICDDEYYLEWVCLIHLNDKMDLLDNVFFHIYLGFQKRLAD